jgi:hypothetical protein
MKNIAKMMLAILASVTMVTQAYAWDFSVSGSAEATWNQTTTKARDNATAITSKDVGSSAGAITITSSHTAGDTSATFSYKFEWDDDWDEVVSLSGSTKAGEWTASSSIDFDVERGAPETADDAPVIAVTNGVTTIQLGLIAPVSNQAVYGGSTAGGNVAFGRDDSDIGAYIDEYDGLGISHKVSDTISVDVGIQMDNDNQSIFGEYDNNLGATASETTAFALGVTANVGPTIGFSYGSGSTKAQNSDDNDSSTSLTTMGLSLSMDLGGPSIAFSYGSYNGEKKPDPAGDSTKDTDTGMGLSFTMPMGSDSVVVSYTSVTQKTETGSTTNTDASANGIEVGYNTSLGPVALSVGYGTQSFKASTGSFSNAAADDKEDGASTQDLEVKMAYSW